MRIQPITNITFLKRKKKVEEPKKKEEEVKIVELTQDEVTISNPKKEDMKIEEEKDAIAEMLGENTERRRTYEEEKARKRMEWEDLIKRPQKFQKAKEDKLNGK